jgi:hypothetical protein
MGETVKRFDAVLFAGVASVLGTVYLLGAMLEMLSEGNATTLLLADSVPAATVFGTLLLLTAGALATDQRWARYLGILAFAGIALFGFPSLSSPSLLPAVQTAIGGLLTLYLVFRNPVHTPERSQVDESTSASKVGSTIR